MAKERKIMDIFIASVIIVFGFGGIGIARELFIRFRGSKTLIKLKFSSAARDPSFDSLYSQMESQQKMTRERLIWMHVPGHEHLR